MKEGVQEIDPRDVYRKLQKGEILERVYTTKDHTGPSVTPITLSMGTLTR